MMRSNTIKNHYSSRKSILKIIYNKKLKKMIYKEIKIYNKNKIKLIVIKTNYKSRIKHYKEFRES